MSTLVMYKPPSKKMQFIMKYAMLSHNDSSQVLVSNKDNAIDHEIQDITHIDPSQVQAPIQENAIDHGMHDVIDRNGHFGKFANCGLPFLFGDLRT